MRGLRSSSTDRREGDGATLGLELLRRLRSFLELRLGGECDLEEVDGDRLDFVVTVSTTTTADSTAFASRSCRRTDGDRLTDGVSLAPRLRRGIHSLELELLPPPADEVSERLLRDCRPRRARLRPRFLDDQLLDSDALPEEDEEKEEEDEKEDEDVSLLDREGNLFRFLLSCRCSRFRLLSSFRSFFWSLRSFVSISCWTRSASALRSFFCWSCSS
jgi:hypothetical protein